MAAPFTSDPSIVADRWRPLTDAEDSVAGVLLDDAAAILLSKIPSIPERVEAGTLDRVLVERVQAAMVIRVLSNPDGKRQETIDDYSWTRDNAVSTGLLYLAEDELALLAPVTQQGSAFTITPFGEPGYSSLPLNWWELNL